MRAAPLLSGVSEPSRGLVKTPGLPRQDQPVILGLRGRRFVY